MRLACSRFRTQNTLSRSSPLRFLLPDDRRRLQEVLLRGVAELEPAPCDRRLGIPHRRRDVAQGGVRANRGRRAGIRRHGPHDRLRLLERRRIPRLHRPLHKDGRLRRAQQSAWVRVCLGVRQPRVVGEIHFDVLHHFDQREANQRRLPRGLRRDANSEHERLLFTRDQVS